MQIAFSEILFKQKKFLFLFHFFIYIPNVGFIVKNKKENFSLWNFVVFMSTDLEREFIELQSSIPSKQNQNQKKL